MPESNPDPARPPSFRPVPTAETAFPLDAAGPASRENPVTTRRCIEIVRKHMTGQIDASEAVRSFNGIIHGPECPQARSEDINRIGRLYSGYVDVTDLPREAMTFAWNCLQDNRGNLPVAVRCRRQSGRVTKDASLLLTYSALYLSAAFSGGTFNIARRTFARLLEEWLRVSIDGKQHVEGFITRARKQGFVDEVRDGSSVLYPIRRADGKFPARKFKISAQFRDWLDRPVVRLCVDKFIGQLHERLIRQIEANQDALADIKRHLRG